MSRLVLSTALLLASTAPVHAEDRPRDLSKDKTLYCVGYAHLDTQWRWTYADSIREFIRVELASEIGIGVQGEGQARCDVFDQIQALEF